MASLSLMVCLLALPLFGMDRAAIQAKPTRTPKANSSAGNPYDILALVNQIRASNGLAPFQANGALMASAQAHSQYQASIGSATHAGAGGSDVKSRALAAGYGGGANISVIENIYSGMNATPQRAVSWWQGDALHLETILSTRHTDAGAGMAVSNSVVYITLDVGAVVGGSAPPAGSAPSGSSAPPASAATPVQSAGASAPTAVAFNPVLIATPDQDGSVIHLVQAGQTLWTIAAAYRIPLPDLLQLNGFTENSYIFPGDKILIKPANPETAAQAESAAAPEALQPTSEPTASQAAPLTAFENPLVRPASSQGLDAPALADSQALQPAPSRTTRRGSDPLLLLILGMMLAGLALFVAGNVLNRRGDPDG